MWYFTQKMIENKYTISNKIDLCGSAYEKI